jgi:Flp pilus assembly protein TadG
MRHPVHLQRQRGATLITVALVMFLLLGFIGMAIDIGRLFVIKSELQTAMDSCALSAAQELDSQTDAITRARNAGKNASDLNRVNFQSNVWGGLGLLDQNTDITFRAADYITPTTTPALARYAQCQHMHTGVQTYLLQALGMFDHGGPADPLLTTNTKNVFALAVATRGPAQSTCPVPLALRPKTAGAPGPNYGYTPGEWITLLTKDDTGANGYVGWANLDGSNNAAETVAEMNGLCGVTIGTNLGTPGVQSAVADNWNWRFGIYKSNQGPTGQFMQPDRTGYIYNASTWPSKSNAYSGPTPATPAGAANYQSQSASYANCINSTTVNGQSLKNCEDLTGYKFNSFKDLIPGGPTSSGGHKDHGTSRRLVVVPVTTSYPGSVADYACMLLLQPLEVGLPTNVQLEYIGNAAVPNSPCATSGLPGGVAGPLVPVLVR